MKSIRLLGPAVCISSAMAAVSGCSGSGAAPAPDGARTVPSVEVVQARSGTLPLEERVNGRVKARNHVEIRAEIEAPIAEVMVRSGEKVAKGQTLVRLRDDTLRDQVRQAEASVRLEQAAAQVAKARVTELQAMVTRARSLAAEALVSRLDLETQEAQLAAAQAAAAQADARVEQAGATLQERRSALDRTVVRAPVSGRVGRRNAEIGMLASTGTILFEVGDLDRLMVEIPLTGEMLRVIRAGQSVRIQAPGGAPIAAQLSRVSPFLAEGSFSTTGEIDVANPDGRMQPGMFVTVDVLYGESERAVLVPSAALWEDPRTGIRGLYVVEVPSGAVPRGVSEQAYPAAFKAVEIVAEGRGSAGIRGLEEGAWVVTIGQHLLSAEKAASVKVRATTWDRVVALQNLQREDLLAGFLEEQQRVARAQGVEPPSIEAFLKKNGGR